MTQEWVLPHLMTTLLRTPHFSPGSSSPWEAAAALRMRTVVSPDPDCSVTKECCFSPPACTLCMPEIQVQFTFSYVASLGAFCSRPTATRPACSVNL